MWGRSLLTRSRALAGQGSHARDETLPGPRMLRIPLFRMRGTGLKGARRSQRQPRVDFVGANWNRVADFGVRPQTPVSPPRS